MKLKNVTLALRVLLLLLALGLPHAHAYNHPCIPATLDDLATIKAKLNQEPWKSGYAALAADGRSSLGYGMRGPFTNVSRKGAYDANLGAWRSDMTAVFNLARMWYFTGNTAYAQKARDILIAWANTQVSFTGNESGLDLGDYAFRFAGGASILRGTWPGWTEADTTAVKNYFTNVLWPATLANGFALGPANKGSLYMTAGIAIAVFCDDTAKFEHIIDLYRNYPSSGLPNTLATGEMGETGRDMGHAYVDLLSRAFVAEVAWKQGVDLYSELDNRLLACGEYYARNTLLFNNPFVPYGTTDYHYWVNSGGPYTANRSGLYLLQNAYKNRRSLPTPWIDRKMEEQPIDADNFMYAKTADASTASPRSPVVLPEVATITAGLTALDINSSAPAGSVSYSAGTWSLTGGGTGTWTNGNDQCFFAYQPINGDCALVARVTSVSHPSSQSAKAGVMIRDSLSPSSARRAWVAITPQVSTHPNAFESYNLGWKDNWGGANWAKRRQNINPGLPYWLKIERHGNYLTSYASQDGTSWAAVTSSYYADLPSTLYIGLFACSVNTTTLTSATFTHVAITGGNDANITTPFAPATLFASASTRDITVRWLPSFGATAYDLLRSTTSGSGYVPIATDLSTDKTSYVDTSVAAGTTYYYVARAKNTVGTSADSPQFSASLLPSPMTNLAFGGTTLASFNSDSVREGSDKAFDGNPGSKWFGWNAPTGWIQYAFGSGHARVVTRYTISSADVAARDPKNWNFLGSQDGVSWTTLDSQSNQSFAYRMQAKTYDIGNTTAYRFYRLDITANNGATGVAIAELGLWGDKVPATIVLSDLAPTYDGTPKSVTATVTPAGVPLTITYNGSTTAPTNAGSYAVVATVADARFTGSATGALTIAKAPAMIALSPIAQAYDGTAKAVTATTGPTGLVVNLTYDGATAAPIYPGPHTVVATIDDANYAGATTATLDIAITALVRHAPILNGILDGSVQVLLPESVALNGNASLSGDLLVAGTPALVVNGQPALVGTREGVGAVAPTNHTVTLSGGSVLRYLVHRVDAIALPIVAAPVTPTGTRSVTLNNGNQNVGDFTTLRDLTLNGNAGVVAIPAGTYGSFTANGNASFVLGVVDATEPAKYELQNLTLNGNATLQVVGPVILTLANGVQFDGVVGSTDHPAWLVLRVAAGGVTLNGTATVHGTVIAPAGTVTVNGSSAIHGSIVADRLALGGNALLDEITP